MERMMWMGGQHKPINFGMAARIGGTITADALAVALEKCTRRHPLSSVRVIVDDDGAPHFTGEDVARVPVLHLNECVDWPSVAARELIQLFDWQAGPFIRLVWLEGTGESILLLICDHMIADGLSAAFFLRDLLTYLGDPGRGCLPARLRRTRRRTSRNHTNHPVAGQPALVSRTAGGAGFWPFHQSRPGGRGLCTWP
jgi:hypothetical protein